MMKIFRDNQLYFSIIGCLVIWIGFHIPGILFGTQDTPLHVSYMTADEQSPINGALHMLKEKSILGLKNQNTLYYGPMFSLFALPAVLGDFSLKLITGEVSGPDSYKDSVVWDWGGILQLARVIAVLVGACGLVAVFLLFRTRTFNKNNRSLYPFVATAFIAGSFLFFEYANFFRHWVFAVSFLLWQIYLTVLIYESEEKKLTLWLLQALLAVMSFGISYLSVVYLIYWLPFLVVWWKEKKWGKFVMFAKYVLVLIAGCGLMIWWHPYGFIRILGVVGLIEPVAMGAVLDLTTSQGQVHSFLFYLRVIVINTALLIPAGVLLLLALRKTGVWKRVYVWVLFLPAFINYVLFSIPSEPETRYMLPSVVFLTLLVLALYFEYRDLSQRENLLYRLITGMLVVSFGAGFVQILLWERIMLDGVPERREFGVLLEKWQTEDIAEKILVIKDWPLGYVHTREAYKDYIERYNKSSYDLWKYILILDPPQGVVPVNVFYYHSQDDVTEKVMSEYAHVVKYIPPQTGSDVLTRSPHDEFDLRPWHMWNFTEYQDSFIVLK